MMWPSNWREQLLRHIGVEVTQYTLNVLSAWHKSTPIEPWTNNPLGHPHVVGRSVKVLNTGYAAFPTHGIFREHVADMLGGGLGQAVLDALTSDGEYGAAWRAIHKLNWPGNKTEEDYPAYVIDLVTGRYELAVSDGRSGKRKTAGVSQPQPPTIAQLSSLTAHVSNARIRISKQTDIGYRIR